MIIDWTLNSVGIPIADVARFTGINQGTLAPMLASGSLGPPLPSRGEAKVPLIHIAALLATVDASKLGIPQDRVQNWVPAMAGGVYIQLARSELAQGRCTPRRGTPALSSQLWNKLRSEEGTKMLEERLPLGEKRTGRYVCFGVSDTFVCQDLAEIDDAKWPLKVINCAAIARRLKSALPGTLFSTEIG
jgi:hypothetical protein